MILSEAILHLQTKSFEVKHAFKTTFSNTLDITSGSDIRR